MFSDTLCSSSLCWINYGDEVQLHVPRDLWEISLASEANATMGKAEALQETANEHTIDQLLHQLPSSFQLLQEKKKKRRIHSVLLSLQNVNKFTPAW